MKIVRYVGDNQLRFNDLVNVFMNGSAIIAQRAGWPISYCVERHPKLILPHMNAILKTLDKPNIHDAVKRNIMRLLQYVEIPKRFYGKVANACFNLLDKKEAIAVRVFSMTVLANIAVREPDLKKELRIIIEDQLPFASAGFLSRAKKILKQLN